MDRNKLMEEEHVGMHISCAIRTLKDTGPSWNLEGIFLVPVTLPHLIIGIVI